MTMSDERLEAMRARLKEHREKRRAGASTGTTASVPNHVALAMSFEALAALECRTQVYREELPGRGVFLILRGFAALTAYIGVPLDHPAAGVPYDELEQFGFDFRVHWSVNFAAFGADEPGFGWDREHYFIGWDYGHAWDATFLRFDPQLRAAFAELAVLDPGREDKEWTVPRVIEDSQEAINVVTLSLIEWENSKKR